MAAAVEKLTIALPQEMVARVLSAVDAGEYASSSEVVLDALGEWNRKRQLQQDGLRELQAAWSEARAEKSAGLDPDAVLDELEQKYGAIITARGNACP